MIIFTAFVACLIFFTYITVHEGVLSEYAIRIDHVYVVSRHPVHKLESTIVNDSEIGQFVTWTNHAYVLRQCETERKLLSDSGNELYGTECDGKECIKVIPLIYQDGAFINESWGEFEKRIVDYILADRKDWHNSLKKKFPQWYDQWGNYQK